jgi:ubiquinone/menaquinone biosynthesis methyltransferase
VAAQQGNGPGRLEAGQVRAMFDRIAGLYDFMNSAMTAGLHHRWRARAADLAGVGLGSRVLDVATGTGDLALELARRVAPGGTVVGCDFSEAMLDRARQKASVAGGPARFEWADALALPYASRSFDAVTVGFGARNFEDLTSGLAEMVRVARPGGRVVVLEFTTPTRPPLSLFYRAWFDCAVPVLGRLAGTTAGLVGHLAGRAEDRTIADAYAYLPASVKRFAGPWALANEMEQAGLEGIRWLITAGGIVSIHVGTRPATLPFQGEQPARTGGERVRMSAVRTSQVSIGGAGSGSAPSDEDAVEAIMRRGGPVLRKQMDRIEAHLEEVTLRAGAPLASHANGTVTAGGKRLRPLLVVLAAQAAGGAAEGASGGTEGASGPARAAGGMPARAAGGTPESETAGEDLVRAAVAVELVHSATLVHDDVIDRAKLRRGHPTVAAMAGRNIAIATGDLLFSRAFAELAHNEDAVQLRALSQASTALAAGEMLQREDAYAADVNEERYLERCELKTAALFEAACRLGALIGVDGSASLADALGRFARSIGLAFQLLDDVLDISGPVERTGKARGTDLLDGTVTLPLILARERDTQVAKVDLASLHEPRQAEELCDRIAATGVLEVARERALGIVVDAKSQLPGTLPGGRATLLELVADAVVERYR